MERLPEKEAGVVRYVVFDTETTGLPDKSAGNKPADWRDSDPNMWPDLLQLTAEVWEIVPGEDVNDLRQCTHRKVGETFNWWVNINGEVPEEAGAINGINKAFLDGQGPHGKSGEVLSSAARYFPEVRDEILQLLNHETLDFVVAHNMPYDEWVIRKNLQKHGGSQDDLRFEREGYPMIFDTTIETKRLCRAVFTKNGGDKRPSLSQLYGMLFPGESIGDAHDARADVAATVRVVHELIRRGIFNPYFIKGETGEHSTNLKIDWPNVDPVHLSGSSWEVRRSEV